MATSPERSTPQLFDLTGRVALVTGSSGRVGRPMCRALAEAGATVVLNGRRRGPLEEQAEELRALGAPKPLIVTADVSREDGVHKLAAGIRDKHENVHVLVNNVTGNNPTRLEEMTIEQWNAAMEGALGTMFLCTKIIGAQMAEDGGGSIVNVGSIYGNQSPDMGIYGDSGYNPSLVYATAKAGVLNFTRYVATYWAAKGVRCNTLTIAGFASPWNTHPTFREGYARKTPLGRMAENEDVKGPIVFLASDASRFVTGENLLVDGGWAAW